MHYRYIITIAIIALCIFLLTKCMSDKSNDEPGIIKNAYGEQFAGSTTCATCHKNIYDTHIHTAHYLTSQPAFERYIKGSFEPGKNTYAFNRSVVVALEKRDSGFYQVEYYGDIEKKTRRIDIVIGSGTMGQSFLNWGKNRLFQLPITYFTAANAWSNSPGFPDRVVFNRPITSRCLECHTTFVKTISAPGKEPEEFDHGQIIFGVDCEKCHGPAARHVEFQSQNPKEKTGKYIVNPATFSRQQNLDLCASCHGGRLQKTKPSFEFIAGDTLSNYFVVDTTGVNPDSVDVHGNQYGLLRISKCFKMSKMTCITCHNTHENEKAKIALFSQRCMSCHNNEHGNLCKMNHTLGSVINTNCIDCHMPLKDSKAIAVQLHGDSIPTAALIRSHFIAIYPDETKRLITLMKKMRQTN
jgi:hypothetical protein